MNNNYTHICVVLDASGSMDSIADDIKGSFNTLIEAEKQDNDKTIIDIYEFSNEITHMIDNQDVKTFDESFMEKYKCDGMTAMNDAICISIDELGKKFYEMDETERPINVIFAIITDGMENASIKYNSNDVKNRIKEQTEKYNWHFQFLAANQDAIESGKSMNISSDSCENFTTDTKGIQCAISNFYAGISCCKQMSMTNCSNESKQSIKDKFLNTLKFNNKKNKKNNKGEN